MSLSLGSAVKEKKEYSIQRVIREAEESMYCKKLLNGKSCRSAVLDTLLATLYEKSTETEEHAKRWEAHCHSIGRKLQLSAKEMDELSLLALLHDIGKVGHQPGYFAETGPAHTCRMGRNEAPPGNRMPDCQSNTGTRICG